MASPDTLAPDSEASFFGWLCKGKFQRGLSMVANPSRDVLIIEGLMKLCVKSKEQTQPL